MMVKSLFLYVCRIASDTFEFEFLDRLVLGISYTTSKEPVCPRVELILKIIIILLIIFLGFIKSKPC